MKRFVWRLQRILEVKTKEEGKKREELIKITEKLVQTRAELITQQRVLDDIISKMSGEKPKHRLSKQEFFLRYSTTSDELIKALKREVNKLELQQKGKINEVLKVKKFKEGLEKLRAKARSRFVKKQEKLEQKELDEIATVSFTRDMKTSHNK